MNKDDIIRMAREAGVVIDGNNSGQDDLLYFAVLVAAAEREKCAKVCDDKAKETFSGQCQTWGDYFARSIRARGTT